MNQLKKVALTLVLMVTCIVASAQSVKGTVKDSHGEPLIGVSILVNGKPVAVTDVDGNFTVSNLSPNRADCQLRWLQASEDEGGTRLRPQHRHERRG